MVLNMLVVLPAVPRTPPTIAKKIKDAIKPYSIAVAPLSLIQNRFANRIIARLSMSNPMPSSLAQVLKISSGNANSAKVSADSAVLRLRVNGS